ncbi:hypothetical protein [Flagellimonas sp. 2504JD4-2]
MKFSTFLFSLLTIAFLVQCESNRIETIEYENLNSEPTTLDILENEFTLKNFNPASNIIKESLEVSWSDFQEYEVDDKSWYEFTIRQKGVEIVHDRISSVAYSLVATLDDDKSPNYWIVQMDSYGDALHKKYMELTSENFTGVVQVYNLKGEFEIVRYFSKGSPSPGLKNLEKYSESRTLDTLEIPDFQSYCDYKSANDICYLNPEQCDPSDLPTGSCTSGGSYEWGVVGEYVVEVYMDRNANGIGEPSEFAYRYDGGDRMGWVWVPSSSSFPSPGVVGLDLGVVDDGSVGYVSGQWSGLSPILDKDSPPDCESFHFVQTSSNWQQSAVVGIYFNIVLVMHEPPYLRYDKTVVLDQPVLFGAPVLDRFGNETSPGLIAEVSAGALHAAMKETANKYGGTQTSYSVVLAYFKQSIADNYALFVPGGRANTNSTTNLIPTIYRPTPIGYGSCD